jgi:hypothetical protein
VSSEELAAKPAFTPKARLVSEEGKSTVPTPSGTPPEKGGNASPLSPAAQPHTGSNLQVAGQPTKPAMLMLGKDVPLLVSIQSQKQWYQEPALYISLLAVAVSLISLVLNLRAAFKKDKKARVQSIQDEFWLRKVLYPLAIEPALEYYAKMLSSSPADRFDPSSTPEAIADFKKEFEQQHSAIVAKNVTLGILGQPFFTSVKAELEAIEDLVTDYCFENSAGYDPVATSTTVATRASFEGQVSGHLVTIMQSIKKLQESIE